MFYRQLSILRSLLDIRWYLHLRGGTLFSVQIKLECSEILLFARAKGVLYLALITAIDYDYYSYYLREEEDVIQHVALTA